ncbi:MAG: peptidase M15 [Streptosporangiales bacterium]|nr:peptidase M15 [Streptosporangiales bacterium]
MPIRRLVAYVPLSCCVAGILIGVSAGPAASFSNEAAAAPVAGASARRAAPPAKQKIDLAELRKRADRARKELERGTKDWEKGRKELDHAQRRLLRTERELAGADRRLDQLRGPIAAVANAAYQSPTASSMAALVSAEHPKSAMRAAVDLHKINSQRAALVDEAARTWTRQQKLARDAEELRKSTTAEADRLARQMHELQANAAKAVKELTKALQKLGMRASRDDRASLGCDPERAGRAAQYPNGLVPQWALCPLPQSGELLRADAALAFYQLNAAYAARFGSNLCVTDSYRSLAEQQSIYAQRPGLAAVPGRSLHGLGMAVDFCGGVQDSGSAAYNWMAANAGRFGWYHPSWAQSSQFEPWHWEYDPKKR